ncbi:hypothetical protein [Limimaricola cinnabarinus]|uniref:hypothetical protein n=1 Tax=Limimaricola cinnabarinus TaxID=1125964 RepID=UPI0011AE4F82|nr:hypothetical protein [Limimaricola cinnabarinus]
MSEVYIFDSNGTATLEVANRRSEPAISAASDSAARKGDWSEMPLSCVSRDRDGDLLVTDWLIMKADQRTLALACNPLLLDRAEAIIGQRMSLAAGCRVDHCIEWRRRAYTKHRALKDGGHLQISPAAMMQAASQQTDPFIT